MTTLQEWLEQEYPNKNEVKKINLEDSEKPNINKGGSLIIKDYPNLEEIDVSDIDMENLDIVNCPKINSIILFSNSLTNIDFLTKLPNPYKLKSLRISSNKIQPTTLEFLTKFPNLETLLLGTEKEDYERKGKINFFYGSLEPLKHLTKLEALCIAGTDIDRGLEYLPDSLVKNNGKIVDGLSSVVCNNVPDCQTVRPGARVKVIQDQLRPFDYDLEAWRIINIPNYNEYKLDKRINKIQDKIADAEKNWGGPTKLKFKKIERLQSLIDILVAAKTKLEQEREGKNQKLVDELTQLQQDQENLTNKLKNHEQTLTNSQQKLTELQTQLAAKQTELKKLERLHRISKMTKEATDKMWKQRSEELREKLADKSEELHKLKLEGIESTAELRKEIDKLKQELTKLETENQTKDTKLTDLNDQLTALALSSGLLTQQCEELTNKLSASEQESQRKQLELEIKSNLLQEKDNSLSEQERAIKNYQLLLRKSEESLAKCQQIISQKSDQLEKIEEEKNALQEQLDQAEDKIKDLENSLLNANNKISQLETQIKDLEAKGDNSNELNKLRKELANLKSQSQSEINGLKTQLHQAKLQEEQLNQQIQSLNIRLKTTETETISNSWWNKAKKPLFIVGLVAILALAIHYFKNRFKF